MNDDYKFMLLKIEAKRELLGMTKAELARRMNMNRVTLGTMLCGKRIIYADELLKLCVFLGINPASLLSPKLRELFNELWGEENK